MKLIIIFLASIVSYASSGQSDSYNKIVNNFINSDELKNSSVGLYAINLETEQIIFENNPNISIVPASILKLFTTATTLEYFDSNKQFETKLAYKGDISVAGILNGDIYILGYGDPALGSNYFNNHYNKPEDLMEKWVKAIKNVGIKKINGSIVGVTAKFGRAVIPDKWMWEDIANYYGAAPSGLNYKDNEYRIHFATGNYEGAETKILRVDPDDIGLSFENYVTSASRGGDQAYIFYDHNTNNRIIRGTLPWKRSNFSIRGSLPYPELYLAQSLTNKLHSSGIIVEESPEVIYDSDKININDLTIFHTTLSPKLSKIIDIINQRSFNLYAEAIALHLVDKLNKDFKDIIIETWSKKGMDTDGLFITDASGLSPASGITPKQMVFLLQYMKNKSNNADTFINSLAVSGKSGTLRRTFTHPILNGKVKAKSGSMTRVRAYAGYLQTKNGQEIAFCIILNNYNCTPIKSRQIIERFLTEVSRV